MIGVNSRCLASTSLKNLKSSCWLLSLSLCPLLSPPPLSLSLYIYIYIYWTYFSRRLFHLLWRSLPVECTWKCMQFETVSEPIFKVWQLAVHLVMWTIISTGCDVSCVSAKSCGKNSLSCVCLYHPKNSGPRYVIIFTHKLIFLPVLALKMTSTSI